MHLQAVRLKEQVSKGRVVSIAYRSDKWTGTLKDYEHECKSRIQLYQAGDVYVISGGKLRVAPSGIQG
jgi:hypothetical protein